MSRADSKDGRLAQVRHEIDAIDDEIADLIVRRMAIVEEVKAAKQSGNDAGPVMRPAREAEIVARIVARTRGALPARSVARIWRELISAATQAQTNFLVHLSDKSGIGALAMAHFGTIAQIVTHESDTDALRAVGEGIADVAVLPVETAADAGPWWLALGEGSTRNLQVVASLPAVCSETDGIAVPQALVVAGFAPARQGDVMAVLVAEGPQGELDALGQGLDVKFRILGQAVPASGDAAVLVCVAGEPEMAARRLGGTDAVRIRPIGAFPVPCTTVEGA